MPFLIKQFNITDEQSSNTVFSIIGTSPAKNNILPLLECLHVMVQVMKTKIEVYAKEILDRASGIVM